MYKGKRVIVIAPAFNEEGKIGKMVSKTPWKIVDEFVVADDGSTDNTAAEAKRAGATVLSLKKNTGMGAAFKKAVEYAKKKEYDYFVHMGGDNQDDPQEIPILLQKLEEGYDLVQGSRYLKGIKDIPLFRLVTTKAFTVFLTIVVGRQMTDGSNGFRAYRRRVVVEQDFSAKWLDKYDYDPYFLIKTIRNGYKFCEVPVSKYFHNSKSYSKMKPITGWWSMLRPLFVVIWENFLTSTFPKRKK